MTFEQALMVRIRIACPEVGYPQAEARFTSIKEWEQDHEDDWQRYRQAMQDSFTSGEDIW